MKKLLLGLTATLLAASVFAQGTVTFNNRVTGVVVAPIYAPLGPTDTAKITGNGADYGARLGVEGTGFTAQLWAANGAGALEGSLAAALPSTTFRLGNAKGFVTATTVTLAGVAKDAAAATLQLRVWDNKGGTITDWAAAEAAWIAGTIAAGKSTLFNVSAIGGDLNTSPNLTGLESFNIYYAVPEPSTFALLGLGTLGMLIFRRK